jgi:hypothetical protein
MELCSGKEEWFHPSESLTKKAMRLAVLNKEKISMDAGLNNATKYNYNNVGNLMKDYLND